MISIHNSINYHSQNKLLLFLGNEVVYLHLFEESHIRSTSEHVRTHHPFAHILSYNWTVLQLRQRNSSSDWDSLIRELKDAGAIEKIGG